jgi:hypothetical protein|tara:strand:+ start:228 stop:2162 length:1935 start_codon:yes stop_codon:yes gene_type:complete
MTTYRNIHGRSIRAVATDPTAEVSEGEIWYNTGSDTFKSILSVEAWSSASAITTPRFNMGSGSNAPVTAGLIFGGSGKSTATEEYNGSGWSNGGALGTGRYEIPGFGVQTAAVGAGGYASPAPGNKSLVEEYNGSSWSEVTDLPTAQRGSACFGTQTAGVLAGGVSTTANLTTSFEYDGTNWTSGGTLPSGTDRTTSAGAGVLTAGLIAAGDTRVSFEYDGTNWTAGPSTASDHDGGADTGVQTAAVVFGGFTSPGSGQITATELYNGTSFTTSPATMANGRYGVGRGGVSGTNAFAAGGDKNPGTITDTEEYNKSANVITGAAWAAGGNMPVAKRVGACSKGGDINSSLTFGGDTLPMGAGQPQVNTTEEYNGTSWSGGGALANNLSGSAGAGTQTAMIGATGYSFPTPWTTAGASYVANAFEYDGSSWTNVTAYPTTGVGLISFGTQTASAFGGGAQGGSPGPEANQKSKDYKEYDGSSWTTGGATNVFHSRTQASAGTQTAGIVYAGGDAPGGNPSGRGDTVEEYNGTAWTSAITAPKENSLGGGFGTQTAFLVTNGSNAPIPSSPGTTGYSFTTFVYDGTTMRTDANTATRRVYLGADGSIGTAAGMVCGGSTSYSSRTTATEEYSQGSTALNVKTLTQS